MKNKEYLHVNNWNPSRLT